MKNRLIIKNLVWILLLAFMVGCSKSNEVSPSSLSGNWKQNGITGKLTIGSGAQAQSFDLSDSADGSIIEFKSDGTGTFEGTPMTYKTSGSILTITLNGGPILEFTAKVSGNNLTLSFTKDQFIKALSVLADPNDPDIKLVIDSKDQITGFEYNANYVKQ
ncbi:MAG: hypothetical protein U5N85_00755 [Arcicella sp.]|nr:hypothetical protein [Arcicella sp.]